MVRIVLLSVSVVQSALAAPQGGTPQPVHVWLEAATPVVPGALVHTFVQTSAPGELIVLHRRTDGGVDVLFPTQPGQDPFTPAGTYEIVSGDRGAAFVAGAVGHGTVLAALAPGPMQFVEFAASSNAWDAAAFTSAAVEPDPESQFTDAVQRMLGDGSFNYDLANYEVVPPVYAYQDSTAPDSGLAPAACDGCSMNPWGGSVVAPAYGCLSLACRALSPFEGREGRGHRCREGCGAPGAVLAAYRGGRPNGILAPTPIGATARSDQRMSRGAERWSRLPGLAVRGGPPLQPATARPAQRELAPIVIVQPRSRPIYTPPDAESRPVRPVARETFRSATRGASTVHAGVVAASRAPALARPFANRSTAPRAEAFTRSTRTGPPPSRAGRREGS